MYIEEITEQTVIPNLMDDENVCMIKRNYSGKLEISELATFQISKIKKYMERKDVAFVIVKERDFVEKNESKELSAAGTED